MIANSFPRSEDPLTGRTRIQLCRGTDYSYPLYYFIDSITKDGRFLVHHRTRGNQVQLYNLDLHTGIEQQLSHGRASQTGWLPWCREAGPGMLDHRSTLDVDRNRALAWDGQSLIAIALKDTSTQSLLQLPSDRLAIGQSCILPGGEWYIYIHADKTRYQAIIDKPEDWQHYWGGRWTCTGTVLAALNLRTGSQHEILRINAPIHHVLPLDEQRMVFCHPTGENGMLLTDINGGWYTQLRTQDAAGSVCHYLATERGLAYEVLANEGMQGQHYGGLYDPHTHARCEWALPSDFGYTHTARDPHGDHFLYERTGNNKHAIVAISDIRGQIQYEPVTGHWQTYGEGQKAHFHPQFVLDKKWILMTGGDPASQSNHCFLLDADDIPRTSGISLQQSQPQ